MTTPAPVIIDWFCREGGASRGYADAGFTVVGVDIKPQPRYPYAFEQADAVEAFDRISAQYRPVAHVGSPPCQAHSQLGRSNPHHYLDLIPATRKMFARSGLPYVIENVEGAPLLDPLLLCGSMFGLGTEQYQLRRHRLFEVSGFTVPDPRCAHDQRPVIGVYGGKARLRRRTPHWGTNLPKAAGEQALGIDWMTIAGLSEAIPPAYTAYIGRFLQPAVQRLKPLRTGPEQVYVR